MRRRKKRQALAVKQKADYAMIDISNGTGPPPGIWFKSFATIADCDGEWITVIPPAGTLGGPIFNASGWAAIRNNVIAEGLLFQRWLWLKVDDPVFRDDGTQSWRIISQCGNGEAKAGAEIFYTDGVVYPSNNGWRP